MAKATPKRAPASTSANVDEHLRTAAPWRDVICALRRILLDAGLNETWKWRAPCYMDGDKNVAVIQELNAYCALGFFQGALLKDPRKLLDAPGEHSQTMRQLRFTGAADVTKLAPVIEAYVREAIENERAGRKVEKTASANPALPAELIAALRKNAALKRAFDALTPGRRRAHAIFIGAAKQTETRAARVKKCAPLIVKGLGPNER